MFDPLTSCTSVDPFTLEIMKGSQMFILASQRFAQNNHISQCEPALTVETLCDNCPEKVQTGLSRLCVKIGGELMDTDGSSATLLPPELTFSCRNLLINPSIVWKISSTFLITWLWGPACDWPLSSSCFSCTASEWLGSGQQEGVSSSDCVHGDITSSRGWGKWLAVGVGGSSGSSVALSPCSVGITK